MNAVESAAFVWLVPLRVHGRTHLVKKYERGGATLCGQDVPHGAGARVASATTCNACHAASCRGVFRVDYGKGGRIR